MKASPTPLGRRKGKDAFRTIGEAAAEIGVEPHVLRFWETKFARLKPLTRAGGRRYYRPEDLVLMRKIKKLLHDDGLTIRGAQKVFQGRQSADLLDSLSQTPDGTEAASPSATPPALQRPAVAQAAQTSAKLRDTLAEIAAEARSIANGGSIQRISPTD